MDSEWKAYWLWALVLAEGLLVIDVSIVWMLGVPLRNFLADAMLFESAFLLISGGIIDMSRSITFKHIRGLRTYRPTDPPPPGQSEGGTVILGETGSLYGAVGALMKRAISPEVGRRLMEITDAVERDYGKGLWIMDTSKGLGTCALSDMLAGGAQIMAYTTGRGNPLGSPIAPVVKITATKQTVERLGEIIDFDASPVLMGMESLENCGKRLLKSIVEVADGKLTQAEKLGHTVFAIGRIVME